MGQPAVASQGRSGLWLCAWARVVATVPCGPRSRLLPLSVLAVEKSGGMGPGSGGTLLFCAWARLAAVVKCGARSRLLPLPFLLPDLEPCADAATYFCPWDAAACTYTGVTVGWLLPWSSLAKASSAEHSPWVTRHCPLVHIRVPPLAQLSMERSLTDFWPTLSQQVLPLLLSSQAGVTGCGL